MSRKAKVKLNLPVVGQLVRISDDYPKRIPIATQMMVRQTGKSQATMQFLDELYVGPMWVGVLVDFDRDSHPVILWSDMRMRRMSFAHLEFV